MKILYLFYKNVTIFFSFHTISKKKEAKLDFQTAFQKMFLGLFTF